MDEYRLVCSRARLILGLKLPFQIGVCRLQLELAHSRTRATSSQCCPSGCTFPAQPHLGCSAVVLPLSTSECFPSSIESAWACLCCRSSAWRKALTTSTKLKCWGLFTLGYLKYAESATRQQHRLVMTPNPQRRAWSCP